MSNQEQRGFCVYFVGIPASGKTTFANSLIAKLKQKISDRNITLLDGDIVRETFSKELGFSHKDRQTNTERIGLAAHEIVQHNGICVVANIAPFKASRDKNRALFAKTSDEYIEVYVKTSLATCIDRDPKQLYKKAKAGMIKNLTGYNDVFEQPKNCDIVINGENEVNGELDKVMQEIKRRGLF